MHSLARYVFVVLGAGLAYLGLLALTPPSADPVVAAAGLVVSNVASAALILRLTSGLLPRPRLAWRSLAASALASSGVFAVWGTYGLQGAAVPVPSTADIPYFASVVLMVTAALLLPGRATTGQERSRMVLDGAIIATSLLLVSWRLVLGPTLAGVEALSLQTVVLVAYPLADVAAVTMALIVVAACGTEQRRSISLVVAGMLAVAAGDTVYGALALTGGWDPGHPSTVLWFVGFPLMALGAHVASSGESRPESTHGAKVRVALLMAPVVAALGVTVWDEASSGRVLVLAVLVILVLIRQTQAVLVELDLREALEQKVLHQTLELRRQVYLDAVTGLGNRALLRDRTVDLHLADTPAALVLLDLDGFKDVNDTLGHAAGDTVLMRIGERLGDVTRDRDTVVRIGGDEFVLLLPETGRRAAAAVADRVLEVVRQPIVLHGRTVEVGCSVGIALADRGTDVDELLRRADLAMYEAKADGGDRAKIFDARMHTHLSDRLQLEADIREGVESGQFIPYYQPIVDAGTGLVTCLEALVRWDHPRRGVLSPFEFLPAAERTGSTVPMGTHVMRTACRELSAWRVDRPDLAVAINLSERQVLDPDLTRVLSEVLDETGLPAEAIHLEVTETVIASADEVRRALTALVDLGVSISIDDFGTGHSSLSRIRQLPFDRLKIDKSFMAEICDGRAPLLDSIIALAKSLGARTVAEGVETEAQLAFLVQHGCDEVQGYLLSRPVPGDHVGGLLRGTRLRAVDPPAGVPSPLPGLVHSLTSVDTGGTEQAIRDLLSELSTLTGLESTFLTTIGEGQQVTRIAHDLDEPVVWEGLSVDWDDTLCKQMVEADLRYTDAVREQLGTLDRLRVQDLQSFVSFPIKDPAGTMIGTLCGASRQRVTVDATALAVMELFSGLLSEKLAALSAVHRVTH